MKCFLIACGLVICLAQGAFSDTIKLFGRSYDKSVAVYGSFIVLPGPTENAGDNAKLDLLVELNLGFTFVTDVSPLAKLENLRFLDLSATAVEDVSPLASLENLREVHLFGASVDDVSQLDKLIEKGLRVRQ